jgi:hypothetical protein
MAFGILSAPLSTTSAWFAKRERPRWVTRGMPQAKVYERGGNRGAASDRAFAAYDDHLSSVEKGKTAT